MTNLQRILFKQLFVLSIYTRLQVVANEPFLVLSCKDVNIQFNSYTFNRFYKCVCNTAMANCVVTTETLARPGDPVNVVNIHPVYTGHYSDTPRRMCAIEQHGLNNLHFTINCTATVAKCHHQISLISHYKENNDLCGSEQIEIRWEPDANISNYSSNFVNVQNCEIETRSEPQETHRSSMISSSMRQSTEYTQVTGEESLSQSGTGANLSDVVKIVASIGGCLMIVFVSIAVCLTTIRRKRMLIFKGKYSQEPSSEKSGHYHTIDLSTVSEPCVNRGFDIHSKPVIQLASGNVTNDPCYSVIEIVDLYPDCSKKLTSKSCGTDKMELNNCGTKVEDSGSTKTKDERLNCSSKEAHTAQNRSLMALPKIPDSNKTVYTDEQCAASSKEHLKRNVYDRIVK